MSEEIQETPKRIGEVLRRTTETNINLHLNLDGEGSFQGTSGVAFLDHMLTLWAKHGFFDLALKAKGDLAVDCHHTVEDIGICLGQALNQAVGDKKGMARYGTAYVPMDEALVMVSIDYSGRSYLVYQVNIPAERLGTFETEMVREFLMALSRSAGLTLHVHQLWGENSHHIIEAVFKALGRALFQATRPLAGVEGVLSTKGAL